MMERVAANADSAGSHPDEAGLYDCPDAIIDDYVDAEQQMLDAMPDAIQAAARYAAALQALQPRKEGLSPAAYAEFLAAYAGLVATAAHVEQSGGTAAMITPQLGTALQNASGDLYNDFYDRPLELPSTGEDT